MRKLVRHATGRAEVTCGALAADPMAGSLVRAPGTRRVPENARY